MQEPLTREINILSIFQKANKIFIYLSFKRETKSQKGNKKWKTTTKKKFNFLRTLEFQLLQLLRQR